HLMSREKFSTILFRLVIEEAGGMKNKPCTAFIAEEINHSPAKGLCDAITSDRSLSPVLFVTYPGKDVRLFFIAGFRLNPRRGSSNTLALLSPLPEMGPFMHAM